MKKNFAVATPTKQEYDALMQWAEKEGITWGSGHKPAVRPYKNDYQNILPYATAGGMQWRRNNQLEVEDGPVVPFSTFAAIQGIELGPAPVTLQLTDSYQAVVDYQAETVTVGCQVIPFTKVEEVYSAMRQHEQAANGQVENLPTRLRWANNELMRGLDTDKVAQLGSFLESCGYNLVKRK